MPAIAMLLQAGLPWLANALMGPDGIAAAAASKIGSALGLSTSTVDAVKNAVSGMKPEDLAVLKKAENDFKLEMTKAGYIHEEQLAKIDLDQITVVNRTIQIELENSEKEEWYQKMWRPLCGFSVALGSFVGVCAVAYLTYKGILLKDANAMVAIPALATSIATILAVPGAAVGIAAWHRGMLQREQANGDK